jgi:uncharacterized membrane protein YhaH (DUF805 family)
MTFFDSIKTCFSKYATFTGRASRSEFWWWVLFTILLSAAFGMISETLGGLASLATLLPSLAVGARRLHDTDRSALLELLLLIPLIGVLILIFFWVQESKGTTRYDDADVTVA